MSREEEAVHALCIASQARPPVLFLGAGFAVEAGYPSVSDFKAEMVKNLSKGMPSSRDELASRNLESIADLYDRRIGGDALNELVRSLFGVPVKTKPRSYDIIAKHAEFDPIITTNYDVGLCAHLNVPPTFKCQDYIERFRSYANERRVVLHLHGHADWLLWHKVLTQQEYSKFYDAPDLGLMVNEIVTLIQARTLVFIGYSISDANISSLFTLLQKSGSRRQTIWVVSPDAQEIAIDKSDLGVNIRPVNLTSSSFFEMYDKITERDESQYPVHIARKLTLREDRVRLVMSALLTFCGNLEVADELIDCICQEHQHEEIGIHIPVSPGNDGLLIIPNESGLAHTDTISVKYGKKVVSIKVYSTKEKIHDSLKNVNNMLKNKNDFGLAVPVSLNKKGEPQL